MQEYEIFQEDQKSHTKLIMEKYSNKNTELFLHQIYKCRDEVMSPAQSPAKHLEDILIRYKVFRIFVETNADLYFVQKYMTDKDSQNPWIVANIERLKSQVISLVFLIESWASINGIQSIVLKLKDESNKRISSKKKEYDTMTRW